MTKVLWYPLPPRPPLAAAAAAAARFLRRRHHQATRVAVAAAVEAATHLEDESAHAAADDEVSRRLDRGAEAEALTRGAAALGRGVGREAEVDRDRRLQDVAANEVGRAVDPEVVPILLHHLRHETLGDGAVAQFPVR